MTRTDLQATLQQTNTLEHLTIDAASLMEPIHSPELVRFAEVNSALASIFEADMPLRQQFVWLSNSQ